MSEGIVSLLGDSTSEKPIKILRDTANSQTLILEGVLPLSEDSYTGKSALIHGVELGFAHAPLHKIYLKSDLVTGPVEVGVRPAFPMEGVSLLLGNDLAGGKVYADPIVSDKPCSIDSDQDDLDIYPACAVTRAMAKKLAVKQDLSEVDDFEYGLEDTIFPDVSYDHSSFKGNVPSYEAKSSICNMPSNEVSSSFNASEKSQLVSEKSQLDSDKSSLIHEQELDPELANLHKRALSFQESNEVPVCIYKRNGVLMRKWRPPDTSPQDDWAIKHQIIVPKPYQKEILSIAHDSPMAGHMGINKTYSKILNHFYWPSLKRDVQDYVRSCHTCQVIGKPSHKIPTAPLHPIPAFNEPFSRVLVDCVGPLPKTRSGNQYLLTIMCVSTRFPEAIPLRNIKAKTIVKALIKFFTLVGLPSQIQSDQGSNFMSGLFQQVMNQLGIQQFKSSAYHPESQGALERYHQTLKSMIRAFCQEYDKDWDEGIPLLLFATREAKQESLGFSPFELVFSHSVRGPLKLLKEKWLADDNVKFNLLEYVIGFKERLSKACQIASQNLASSQEKMKTWYDKKAQARSFEPGDKVLILLPIHDNPLQAKFHGPYEIKSKLNDLNYIVKTPDRRKETQLCHINMLKKYHERDKVAPVATVTSSSTDTV